MEGCIFCRIVKGEIPCSKIYEDKDFLAFLDISPTNYGHSLVIPKEHLEIFTDIPDKKLAQLIVVTKMVAKAVHKTTNADGFNLIMNNKKESGQLVPHAHFHIIPRFKDDFHAAFPHLKYEGNGMETMRKKVVENLK